MINRAGSGNSARRRFLPNGIVSDWRDDIIRMNLDEDLQVILMATDGIFEAGRLYERYSLKSG
jgi:serine phosphatase RsbU (regulator of sigma subunit)